MDTTRRQALAGAAALALLPRSVAALELDKPRTIRPGRLRPGDTIGLVNPAGAVWEPVNVEIVAESLAALGFKTKRGANLLARHGYFAGDDEQRAADLNRMFADPDVRAIHCVRGGWGCARLLPLLDWKTIAKNPKILLGYSDITALHMAINGKTGLITFHGPIGLGRWDAWSVEYYKRVVMNGEQVTYKNKQGINPDRNSLTQVEFRVQTITPGKARGRLLGGNLTVLTTILGSPYLPDWDGAILFCEDVGEDYYRIDRMMTQLKLAGILAKLKGFVFGGCSECGPGDGNFGALTLEEIFQDHVKPLGIPAWQGAMIGHAQPQWTLPVGAEVEIDASAGTITLLESAVR
jgi:muramoyltetrapeptide carboxypeptidase